MLIQNPSNLEKAIRPPLWLYLFGVFPAPTISGAQMIQKWLDFEGTNTVPPDPKVLLLAAVLPFAACTFCYLRSATKKTLVFTIIASNLAGLLLAQLAQAPTVPVAIVAPAKTNTGQT